MDSRLLLALYLSLLSCLLSEAPAVAARDPTSYIQFLKDYERTHDCLCVTVSSEYDFLCNIVKKGPISSAHNASTNCSDLPTKVIAHLSINCSNCTECVTVNLHEMTRSHIDESQNITVYPPSEISLHDCQINSMNIRMQQLEGVSITEGMEVAQFGVPQSPGVGGYYTVNVSYPPKFNESDCWLSYLHINRTNMWFLPAYVMQKCQRIRSIDIVGSPITWVSMTDLLALRSIDSLTLRDCNVRTFADDAISKALEALDEYLHHAGSQLVYQNARVTEAVKRLHQMRQDSGRLNLVTHLYDMMDSFNISFSLLFGFRSRSQNSSSESDIPYATALSYLNLAFNDLTEIPFAISMFGNLAHINLSHNKIGSLYHSWLCWYPPIPDSEKNTSNRHCYWFRGSRQTLKVLDLSYNRIDQIGEIQPWHGVALAELYLQNNAIINLHPDAFKYSLLTSSLLKLFLDHNQLPYIHLDSLRRLEVLSMENGSLANIELISIPRSNRLRLINFPGNNIGSIAPNAFDKDLSALGTIDLRNNSLKQLFADSFVMTERTTLNSRVALFISQQRVNTVCDCNHVYAQILKEEIGLPRSNYRYPAIPNGELNSTECEFVSMTDSASKTHKRIMYGTKYRDYLCEFGGDVPQKIPNDLCKRPQTAAMIPTSSWNMTNLINSITECWETCVPQCTCYRSAEWEISNLYCSGIDLNMVRIVLRIPVKYMFLSGIQGSDYFHRITDSTLKWRTQNLSNALLVLYLNNSNVHHIEESAFVQKPSIMLLYLDDNMLESIPSKAFCTPDSNLKRLSLTRNNLTWVDPYILNGQCLPKLNELMISENPWTCECDTKWTSLHNRLLEVSRTTQVVADFQNMFCQVERKIIEACNTNRENEQWQKDCEKVFESNGSRDYPVSDEGRLIRVCNRMADADAEKRWQIVVFTFVGAFGLVLLCLAILAVRRRHRLLAVVRVLVLLKYQRDRRQHKQASRDSLPYDAMMWASDSDQDCLVDVLNCVRSASGGDELELCVPESFLYSDLCSCPLTYFDCPAEGAKFSGKVVVALSERFLDTQYLALLQVIRELDSVGRNPFKDIVFLRLSSRKVSLPRQRQPGPDDVEAFKTLQGILAGSDIVYKSVDWQYRLIERIRRHDSAVDFASVAPGTDAASVGEFVGPGASDTGELVELPDEEQQSLVVDVDHYLDLMRRRITRTIRDWPPFHSDKVSEVFILSAPDSGSETRLEMTSSKRSVVEQIVHRLPGFRLGTNDAALAANWPDNFEAVTSADRINSFMMKRTRQFVLLLNNGLLSWLRDESELLCEFQAFLAANSFRRRLLVIFIGQVDGRSRARYEALANQRLDGGESGLATNWFDITTEGFDIESLGCWLDCALYKRPG